MHEFFHPAVVRDERLEKHRARRVSLEGAHRNLALFEGYRVAAGVETIDAQRTHRGQDAAGVAIHDLLRLQAGRVFFQQRRTRWEYERQPQPSLARAHDTSTGKPAGHADAVALARSAIWMIAADRDGASRRRIYKQDGRRLAPGDRVEKVQLEAEQIVGSQRRRGDYVEIGHEEDYSRGGPLHPPETPSGFRTSPLLE